LIGICKSGSSPQLLAEKVVAVFGLPVGWEFDFEVVFGLLVSGSEEVFGFLVAALQVFRLVSDPAVLLLTAVLLAGCSPTATSHL